jgi:hypothetical protein
MTKSDGKEESLWLKAFCPESSCFQVEERIDLSPVGRPKSQEYTGGSQGLFDEIFCPEDFCEVYESTDLP